MPTANRPANHLYYGDNLDVLRRDIADASVDLVYLDPPFNSNATYNLLFRSADGAEADAQIEAFQDTWHWTDEAEDAFDQVARSGHIKAFDMLNAMRSFLGENDMMAYLAMMAVRIIELHRVLKPVGSLYLHCDPTASHYLKLLLDAIFGIAQFRNEVYWHYYNKMHDNRKKLFARATDTLLFYVKDTGSSFTFHHLMEKRESPVKQLARVKREGRLVNARDEDGHLIYRLKEDRHIDNVWRMPMLQPASPERLGYPTQKPLALLERIIAASSNEGDVVLDPFCGCGTAVHAAQKLDRRWIGIDVTHLAISLIEKRMQAAFPGVAFTVEGTPKDLASAEDLARRDKYQFQWWAVSMVDAMPYGGRKKGADGGIDGIIYFKPDGKRTEKALVSVKGGDNVGVPMIRDLHSAMEREKAPVGVFLTKALPTAAMEKEAAAVGRFHAEATGKSYPRLQILTLAELFQGRRPDIPYVDPGGAFRRAAREEMGRQGSLL